MKPCPARFPEHHSGNWPIYNLGSKPIKREHRHRLRCLPRAAALGASLGRGKSARGPQPAAPPPRLPSAQKAPLTGLAAASQVLNAGIKIKALILEGKYSRISAALRRGWRCTCARRLRQRPAPKPHGGQELGVCPHGEQLRDMQWPF